VHAPFLGLKVNSSSFCLQEKYEGKGQTLTLFFFEANSTEAQVGSELNYSESHKISNLIDADGESLTLIVLQLFAGYFLADTLGMVFRGGIV
jgi:hypothetical protein